MPAYVPNASDTSQPTSSQKVESAALEFRTLKATVVANTAAITANATAAAIATAALTSRALRVPESIVAALPTTTARAGKVLAFDAAGDPVVMAFAGTADPALRVDLAASTGSSLVGYLASGVGAVAQTVADWLSDEVRVTSWMSLAQKIDARLGAKTLELSTVVQACIDASKGKEIVFPSGYSYWLQGVVLSGASYNGTRLKVKGELNLKPAPTLGANNFQSVWCGVAFHNVDRCGFEGKFSGDRTAQQDREQTHAIVLAGVTNFSAPNTVLRELRGDGYYLSQADIGASSAQSSNVHFGDLIGVNSGDDGRNLLSIISADNVTVDSFSSIGVGGVVGGVRQPGGLDIEPNFFYQTVDGVQIGSAFVRSAGTSCFGVIGKDDGAENYNISNVTVGLLDSKNTNPAATDGHYAAVITGVKTIVAKGIARTYSSAVGSGVLVDRCKNANVDFVIDAAKYGVTVGYTGWARHSTIRVQVNSYSVSGVRTTGVSDSILLGRVTGAASSASTFAVQARNLGRGITQTNVTYSIDCPFDGLNARGYRNETADPMSFASCAINNANVSGYSFATGIDDFVAGVDWINIFGYDTATAMPTSGKWPAGVFVRRRNPAKDANSMSVFGWHRATSGSAHVAETDWFTARVSLVSPAI